MEKSSRHAERAGWSAEEGDSSPGSQTEPVHTRDSAALPRRDIGHPFSALQDRRAQTAGGSTVPQITRC